MAISRVFPVEGIYKTLENREMAGFAAFQGLWDVFFWTLGT